MTDRGHVSGALATVWAVSSQHATKQGDSRMFALKTRGRYRAAKQGRSGWLLLGAVAAALVAPVVTAGVANAGLGEDVVGDWAALDTNTAEGQSHWTPDAVVSPSADSRFIDEHTARLVFQPNEQNNLGTSLEIEDLGMPLNGGIAYFCFSLEDGAVFGGGAPRLFVEVDGVYRNTVDHGLTESLPNEYGDSCGEYTHMATLSLPTGTVGHVGVVYDNGLPGSVLVLRPTIGNTGILFPTEDQEHEQNVGRLVSELAKNPDKALEHAKGKGALSKRN